MKITQRQLRAVIRSVLKEQLNETTMSQGRVAGPLKNFVTHLNMAKEDLGVLFQQITDETATAQVESLLKYINRILDALDKMPQLTQDPFSNPGHRRNLTCFV